MAKRRLLGDWLAVRLGMVVLTGVEAIALAPAAFAQRELQRGVMQFEQMAALQQKPTTLSSGTLSELRSDPNFNGDFATMVNEAVQLLQGYTIVRRGGFFPENEGIPREQQLTTAQVAYRVYTLGDRRELVLFRTLRTGTVQYFIRQLEDSPSQPPRRQRLG